MKSVSFGGRTYGRGSLLTTDMEAGDPLNGSDNCGNGCKHLVGMLCSGDLTPDIGRNESDAHVAS